jgi:hypothetical protein
MSIILRVYALYSTTVQQLPLHMEDPRNQVSCCLIIFYSMIHHVSAHHTIQNFATLQLYAALLELLMSMKWKSPLYIN